MRPARTSPVFDVTPQPVGGDYRVVWTVQGDGLFSNRLDGSDRRLVSSLDPRNPFDYPPDGAEVVFRHGGLFAAPVLGGGERVLSNLGAEGFAVAPDGSRVFFVDADFTVFPEQYRLWSVPFDGSPGELRHDQTLSSAAGVSSWFPAPTSDGVFYAATRAAGESLRIYWSPAALPGWTELSDLGRAQGNFLVAGDGRRIGYADSLPNVVIKPMHLYTRSLDPDRDQDGLAEACDCNDFDVSQLPPAEIVDSLRLSSQAGATRLAWTAPDGIGPGDAYTTMRAVTPDADTGSGAIECLGGPSPALEVIDPSVPPIGAAFSYVVRVDNGCGSGPLNDGRTAGETRVCP